MPPKKFAVAASGSKDIRNFFGGKPAEKTQTSQASSDDKKTKGSKPSVNKRPILDSDDDDSFFPVKNANKKKNKIDSGDELEIIQPKPQKETKPKIAPKPEPVLKPVDVASVFGNNPIHQAERPTVTKRKELPKEEHDDEDFLATLEDVDKAGLLQHKKARPEPKTPTKDTGSLSRRTALKEKKPSSESQPNQSLRRSPRKTSPVKERPGSRTQNSSVDDRKEEKETKIKTEKEPSKGVRSSPRKPEAKERSESSTQSSATNDGQERKKIETKTEKELSKGVRSSPRKSQVRTQSPARTYVREKTPPKLSHSTTPLKKKPAGTEIKPELKSRHASAESTATRTTPKKVKAEDTHAKSPPMSEESQTPARKGANYQQYLHREGPKHLGAKPIPQGREGCLKGLTFVVTGVLDSLERERAESLVREYGGKVTHAVSKKTSYILAGEEPGPAKIAKAQSFGTPVINEDDFLQMIASRPGAEGDTEVKMAPKGKLAASKEKSNTPHVSAASRKPTVQSSVKREAENGESATSIIEPAVKAVQPNLAEASVPYVEKYKPTSSKGIIGQQGDKSNVKKLTHWLEHWHQNHSGGKKLQRPSPWAKNDDGAFFKAALLSGPPGVGKTTTAYLVCKELGYDLVEMNASDTRSKRLLQEHVTELISNQSINNFFHGRKGDDGRKHVLLMDEVDGMAGNEDRGGMQELIALIKSSKVPIICTCNDRSHPKMRSLSNYCFDLRFQRPRLEQIRGAMMSVCYKEGIKIKPDVLDSIILGANQDVRQILHNLSMWSAKEKTMTQEQTQKDAKQAQKNMKMGPWDVVRTVFSSSEHKGMSLQDKSDLFFHDYSLGPLMVQENYLSVVPHVAKGEMKKTLNLVSATADSLSMGDIVERNIRSNNAWSLLTVQAMYSSVIPGELMEGHMAAQINFPTWLGRNSRTNKIDRLLQELQVHMRLRISGGKRALNLDYAQQLRQAILSPLQQGTEGVAPAIQTMETYDLLREDLDSLLEITQWPGKPEPMSSVDSKVKSAFTRAYNKENRMTPYAAGVGVSKGRGGAIAVSADELAADNEEDLLDDANGSDDNEDEDVTHDAMIKVKKTAPAKGRGSKVKSETPAEETSRAKGRGKAPQSKTRKAK